MDKTDHVIQIGRWLSDDISRLILFRWNKGQDEQAPKRNFQSVMENKRVFFAEASDGEIKKLVDNSAQRNTKKSAKHTGTIYVRSPREMIRKVIKAMNLSGLLVFRKVMPKAERLSEK